ncbi:MAG TPA: hypothetical protein DCO83_14405 [Mucilaginibacter sp.]|jgi:hypothetical protein|nr:hypothetical protein [Mucilaginibacter sp.]
MKTLTVPFIRPEDLKQDKLPDHPIDQKPWAKEGDLSCEAAFSISHFNHGLCIRYSVIEPFLRVKKRKINGAVQKDNCVEFFIALDEDKSYYNFEFNCLGSIKGAFGEGRQHRQFLSANILSSIQDSMGISLNNIGKANQIRWTLKVILPMSAFSHHNQQSLSGINCRANFTKCGDGLPNPHFLSWTDIPTANPDFHQPSYFGKLIFEPYDL